MPLAGFEHVIRAVKRPQDVRLTLHGERERRSSRLRHQMKYVLFVNVMSAQVLLENAAKHPEIKKRALGTDEKRFEILLWKKERRTKRK